MMRTYKVSNTFHKVYDDKDELPEGLVIRDNWKEAQIGDWIQADDGCYIQILRKVRWLLTGERIGSGIMWERVQEHLCVLRM